MIVARYREASGLIDSYENSEKKTCKQLSAPINKKWRKKNNGKNQIFTET
jgi:hypothetical protein